MNETAKQFINEIAPIIVEEGNKRGYKIHSTIVAQAVIESRYGQSTLGSRYHNYFGIKCGKLWLAAGKPAVSLKTKEEYSIGKLTTINDYFRVYPDMESGVIGYYDFINTKRYANLKQAVTYRQYAEFLKLDGYATSSSYVNTLCNAVEQYGLTVWDHGGVAVPDVPLWEVGQTYTTQQNLNIRKEPDGEFVSWDDISDNAKEHSEDQDGHPVLKKGTRVTVKGIEERGSTTWLQIPSGWICGKNSKNIYVI